jgi:uncharacterized protein (TIGR03435 family)
MLVLALVAVSLVMVPMLGALQPSLLLAQTQVAEPVPSFEVASVKPNKSGERTGPYLRYEGMQVVVVNNNLFTIMRGAWGLPPDQIVGGPDWVRSERERFDILAKAPDGATRPQLPLMVRALLADRFKLKTHLENRTAPIYTLVVARPDGRLGPKISPSTFDCTSWLAARNRGERVDPPSSNGDRLTCGLQSSLGSIRGRGQVADFARVLSFLNVLGRPVVDRSGLTADYEFELRWTPDGARQADPDLPSLFTAVQEQLGLKLEATTGSVEMLVIDSVERPTPD